MLETELGKSAIRLDNTNDDAARLCAYGRMAKILDVLRGSPVAAGLLLGLLLLGVPAPVGAQDDGDLRLVRTESVNTLVGSCVGGRPEIFDDEDGDGTGKWKGICDDGLEDLNDAVEEAQVMCRQLDCSGGLMTVTPPEGQSSPSYSVERSMPPMLLSDLVCTGSEAKLLDCSHGGRGTHICFNQEYNWILCEDPPDPDNSVATGTVTITGDTEYEATLTASVSNVSDDDGVPDNPDYSYQWVRVNHLITVRHEGLVEISGATGSTYVLGRDDFGMKIMVKASFEDNEGYTEELLSADAGPVILPTTVSEEDSNYFDGRVRLVDRATGRYKGRVEIFDISSRQWKGVCDDHWDSTDAKVVCRQLGLGTAAAFGWGNITPPTSSSTSEFLMKFVACTGSESKLLDCTHTKTGLGLCSVNEHAGAGCAD